MKKPRQARSSRLSLQTKLAQVVDQRDSYLEALETIADVLEDAGILDSAEEEEEPEVIEGTAEEVTAEEEPAQEDQKLLPQQ